MRIGAVRLGEIPRVVLATSGDTRSLAKAAAAGVDILEFRVDQLREPHPAKITQEVRRLKRYGLPIVGTVRSPDEGGAGNLSNAQRIAFYTAISSMVDAVDIELASVHALADALAVARQNNNSIILSYHNFTKTPTSSHLEDLLDRARDNGADVIKIAAYASGADDVVRLFRFTDDHRDSNLVTISMGPNGSISRLMFPLAGSLLSYTNIQPTDGQIPLDTLIDHLRFYYPAYNQDIVRRLKLLEYA